MEGRFISLDVGTRRIGVAVSDSSGMMALPSRTVEGRDSGRAAREIIEMAREAEAVGVVVGWPLDMSGRESRAVDRVKRFLVILEREMKVRKLALPIHRWDERMTSSVADRLLDDAEVSRSRRKEAIDQLAATQILQGFLDHRRITAGGQG